MTVTREDMRSRTITEGLVRCLTAAGMHCPECQGWGSVDPSSLPDADGPILGCDVCNDPHCYRSEGIPRIVCPTCKGSRMALEYQQEREPEPSDAPIWPEREITTTALCTMTRTQIPADKMAAYTAEVEANCRKARGA